MPPITPAGDPAMPVIALQDVHKRFGSFVAVEQANFDIPRGEFFSMLGPSGCGKTTMLRMIAGFEEVTSGHIRLDGVDVSDVPPYRRNVNTVFQQYALFPHLNVFDNVAFGPRTKGVDEATTKQRVAQMLDVVRLGDLALRRPDQLSGGQRQRVALARALVNFPSALLLDEPLGALDLKLRQAMQIELKEIQQQVGLTFIYVTHDQEEALTMSDRLAVFSHGRVEQVGTPAEVYERPATGFVAGFVGVSNVLEGEPAIAITGKADAFTVRPEKIAMVEPGTDVHPEDCTATGHVREVVYLGAVTRYIVSLDVGSTLVVLQQNLTTSSMEALQVQGKAVRLVWRADSNRHVEAPAGADDGSIDPGEETA